MRLGSSEVASRFRMGFANLHHTKKDNTVWAVSNLREINKRIVRKPFPIPKVSTVLQELEGMTYATALDLNMGYYTIRLDPHASKTDHKNLMQDALGLTSDRVDCWRLLLEEYGPTIMYIKGIVHNTAADAIS